MKTTLLFWAVNVMPVALILAIFEIWLEKHKHGPWGKTEFKNPYWEEKLNWPVPFLKYISRYHKIMFLYVMPILFVGSIMVWGKVLGYPVFKESGPWYTNVLSYAAFFLALWLGNSGSEDFLYFAIQSATGWREPHALRRVVLEKDFAWFKDWLPPICGLHIPGHWVACPTGALVLLYVREYWLIC